MYIVMVCEGTGFMKNKWEKILKGFLLSLLLQLQYIDSSNRCSPICRPSLPDQVRRRKTHMEGAGSARLSRSIRSISSLAIFVIGCVFLFPISLQAQLGKVTTSVIGIACSMSPA